MAKKIITGVIAFSLLIALGTYGIYSFFYPNDGKRDTAKKISGEDTFVATGKINIVVMGVDERTEDYGRTDTLFVLMYEPKKDKLSLLSIPRDTRVRIPNHGWDKINHAYGYNGAETTVSTLENFLGIKLDYYVKVDLKGFQKIIDSIGGIEIDVEKRMYYEDPWDDDGLLIDLQPGLQTLNGQKAMHYVRYRDEEGDIGRIKRQQKFVKAVYEKIATPGMIIKLPSLITTLYGSIETDISLTELLKLGNTLYKNGKSNMTSFSVPGEPVDIKGVNYWIPDIVALRTEIGQILELGNQSKYLDSGRTLAGVYESSMPSPDAYSDKLEKEDKTDDKDTTDKKDDKKKDGETEKKDDKNSGTTKSEGNTTKDKPGVDNKNPTSKAKEVRAAVVNCSGDAAAGKRMEALLERNGIKVLSLSNSKEEQAGSSIVASTNDSWVVSKLASLPFRYALKISQGSSNFDAVIYVGKDFL